jgi:lipopolysaccharide export system protein LptA
VDQSGNVHFQSADRSGQAARSHVDRATDVVTLTGSAEATDSASHTTADTITFNQNQSKSQTQNDVRADGHVVTTYRKPAVAATTATASSGATGAPLNLGPEPANIAAEHLVGNSVTGHAVYSGHARLWQGDSIMEADEIELDRVKNQLDARGNVRAVFMQVGASAAKPIGPQAPPPRSRGGTSAKPARPATQTPEPAGPDVIRVHASTLTYWNAQSKAHMDGGCTADSRQGTITGQACDLFFAPMNAADHSGQPGLAAQAVKTAPADTTRASPGATQRLDHAIFIGNVVVHQFDRRATGERGEYDAAADKFVISGGNPALYDVSGNVKRGRQLTFFLADDTILVESEAGVQTVTRYQVKK